MIHPGNHFLDFIVQFSLTVDHLLQRRLRLVIAQELSLCFARFHHLLLVGKRYFGVNFLIAHFALQDFARYFRLSLHWFSRLHRLLWSAEDRNAPRKGVFRGLRRSSSRVHNDALFAELERAVF